MLKRVPPEAMGTCERIMRIKEMEGKSNEIQKYVDTLYSFPHDHTKQEMSRAVINLMVHIGKEC